MGGLELVILFYKESKSKKKVFCGGVGGGGRAGGRSGVGETGRLE